MGNGSFCVNVKDYISDVNNTMQNNKTENGIFPNNNNMSSYYAHTSPNNLNYSNFITINSRKWYPAAPKNNINNINTNTTTFNHKEPKELNFETENINLKSGNNQNFNDFNNNLPNISYGDKYIGELYNNIPYGKGKYFSSNGEIREGNFINGKLKRKAKMMLIKICKIIV